jgi:surface polysaccharide O-acyltransferase-like enzyme
MESPSSTERLSPKEHIVWFDFVRLLAMILLVCCHSADPFNFYAGSGASLVQHQFIGALWGSAMRPCVPLFVMLTGALLLPVHQQAGPFYRRRISRVLWPFLIWSFLYNIFPWLLSVLGYGSNAIMTFFPYAAQTPMTFGYAALKIAEIPLNFTPVACHMWYIYLIIGLYLYLPIFSAWVEKASERAKLFFLLAWGVTLFLPYYRYFADQYIWGECAWNAFSMVYYFAGFNGYLLLGHYLRNHPLPLQRVISIGIPMFIVGYFITYFGFTTMRAQPNATEPMTELFFTYNSINVVIMTIPLFMLSQCIHIKNLKFIHLLADLTVCGFGIYMIHYFFIGPCFILVNTIHVPPVIQIPISGILAFSISWVLVHFLKKLLGKSSKIALGV